MIYILCLNIFTKFPEKKTWYFFHHPVASFQAGPFNLHPPLGFSSEFATHHRCLPPFQVTFFTQFMELIEETEERGLDTDPFRMCIADVSRELDCGAFAQGERHLDLIDGLDFYDDFFMG